jgi:hypothetical protein
MPRRSVNLCKTSLFFDVTATPDEAVDVTAVNDEFVSGRLFRELGHAIKMNKEGDRPRL